MLYYQLNLEAFGYMMKKKIKDMRLNCFKFKNFDRKMMTLTFDLEIWVQQVKDVP